MIAAILIIIAILALAFVVLAVLWTIVEPNQVHVVVQGKILKAYAAHEDHRHNTESGAYFRIPSWVPLIGMDVTEIPLDVMRVPLEGFLAFDKDRVRFGCDISANMVVVDPIEAAKRFPRAKGELTAQLMDVTKESVRDTTTKSPIHVIINERDVVGNAIQKSMAEQVKEWGIKLIVLNLTDIKDADGVKDSEGHELKPVAAISSIKETAIVCDARQANALQHQMAKVAEAENDEIARLREIERDEKVGVATELQKQKVEVQEQVKEQNVQKEKEDTKRKEMAVQEVADVRDKEIEAKAKIAAAEGTRDSMKIEAEGQKLKDSLEGEGRGTRLKLEGEGEADAIEAKGVATALAKEKEAEALDKYEEKSLIALLGRAKIEADRDVGIAAADAVSYADLKFIQTGKLDSLTSFISPSGGALMGAMDEGFSEGSPDGKGLLKSLGGILNQVKGVGKATSEPASRRRARKEKPKPELAVEPPKPAPKPKPKPKPSPEPAEPAPVQVPKESKPAQKKSGRKITKK